MPDATAVTVAQDPEAQVRAALATHPRTAALAAVPLSVQPGGLSNHAWLAEAAAAQYFVRLSPPDPGRLGVDRGSECAVLGLVAAAGFAPEVVRCDPSQRLLVTRRIRGRPWRRDEAIEPRNIARLAHMLRRLHSLAPPATVGSVDFVAQARHLEAQCATAPAGPAALREHAMASLAVVQAGAGVPALCHNDLHHLNLLDDGDRLWLVDWEYGGAGDPVFDLASFLCQHDCGAPEQAALLEAYGDDGRVDAVRLAAACHAFDYVQWLWYRAWPGADAAAGPVYAARAEVLEQRLSGARG